MKIESYKPNHYKPFAVNRDGEGKSEIGCKEGVVKFFTCEAKVIRPSFTHMEMWIYPRTYYAIIRKHYRPRWWNRLAREFARNAGLQAKKGRVAK